jgi:hypothetical protein
MQMLRSRFKLGPGDILQEVTFGMMRREGEFGGLVLRPYRTDK